LVATDAERILEGEAMSAFVKLMIGVVLGAFFGGIVGVLGNINVIGPAAVGAGIGLIVAFGALGIPALPRDNQDLFPS
jgi:hypothetical protein